MFDFQLDRSRRFLRITVRGYWDAEILARYEMAAREELDKLRRLGGQSSCLFDNTEFQVQAKEIIEQIQALISERTFWADRVAVVAPYALNKMQISRVAAEAPPGERKIFASVAEAEEWLFPSDER